MMPTLRAMVLTMAILAAAFQVTSAQLILATPVSAQSLLSSVNLPVEALGSVSLPTIPPAPRNLRLPHLDQKHTPSTKRAAEPRKSPEGTCLPVAQYFVSSVALQNYMNSTMPEKMEEKAKCESMHVVGVIGKVLSAVSDSDFLDILKVVEPSSLLSGEGGLLGVLGGIAGDPLSAVGGAGLLGGIAGDPLSAVGGAGLLGGIAGDPLSAVGGAGLLGGVASKPLSAAGGAGLLGGVASKPLSAAGGAGLLGGVASKPLSAVGGAGLLGGVASKPLSAVGGAGLLGGVASKPLSAVGGAGLLGGVASKPLSAAGRAAHEPLNALSSAKHETLRGILPHNPLANLPQAPFKSMGERSAYLDRMRSNRLPLSHSDVPDLVKTGSSLGSLALKGEKNNLKGTVDSSLPQATKLSEVAEEGTKKVKDLSKDEGSTAMSALNSLTGVVDLKKLTALKVEKVEMKSVMTTVNEEGVLVSRGLAMATLRGDGLTGVVWDTVGFEVSMEMIIHSALDKNNSECVGLKVLHEETNITEVNMTLLQTVTDVIPVSLDLNSKVKMLLTADMNKKKEEGLACSCNFTDFNECHNSTGMFHYEVNHMQCSADGWSISYCAKGTFNGKIMPIPGCSDLSDDKTANHSLTICNTVFKNILNACAKQSSTTVGSLRVKVFEMQYTYMPKDRVKVAYNVNIYDAGEIMTGRTEISLWHVFMLLKDKITPDIKIISTKHLVEADKVGKVKNVMISVKSKMAQCIIDYVNQWDVPTISKLFILSAKFTNIEKDNLQAAD